MKRTYQAVAARLEALGNALDVPLEKMAQAVLAMDTGVRGEAADTQTVRLRDTQSLLSALNALKTAGEQAQQRSVLSQRMAEADREHASMARSARAALTEQTLLEQAALHDGERAISRRQAAQAFDRRMQALSAPKQAVDDALTQAAQQLSVFNRVVSPEAAESIGVPIGTGRRKKGGKGKKRAWYDRLTGGRDENTRLAPR